jgi:hypothetical protein
MAMVFCRGCGKEIHETASMCPHCGYEYQHQKAIGGNIWVASFSFILAVLCFLNWFDVKTWNADVIVGLWMFSIASIALGSISLSKRYSGKIFNYISIGVSTLTIIMLLGKL